MTPHEQAIEALEKRFTEIDRQIIDLSGLMEVEQHKEILIARRDEVESALASLRSEPSGSVSDGSYREVLTASLAMQDELIDRLIRDLRKVRPAPAHYAKVVKMKKQWRVETPRADHYFDNETAAIEVAKTVNEAWDRARSSTPAVPSVEEIMEVVKEWGKCSWCDGEGEVGPEPCRECRETGTVLPDLDVLRLRLTQALRSPTVDGRSGEAPSASLDGRSAPSSRTAEAAHLGPPNAPSHETLRDKVERKKRCFDIADKRFPANDEQAAAFERSPEAVGYAEALFQMGEGRPPTLGLGWIHYLDNDKPNLGEEVLLLGYSEHDNSYDASLGQYTERGIEPYALNGLVMWWRRLGDFPPLPLPDLPAPAQAIEVAAEGGSQSSATEPTQSAVPSRHAPKANSSPSTEQDPTAR